MAGWSAARLRQLHELARLYGLYLSYHDGLTGRLVHPPPESLLAVARACGAPVASASDVPGAVRERHREQWSRPIAPVLAAFGGRLPRIDLRLPASVFRSRVEVRLDLEDGDVRRWTLDLAEGPRGAAPRVDGVRYRVGFMSVPGPLPYGYHRLRARVGALVARARIISAPERAWLPGEGESGRSWGLFLPLYALRTGTGAGAGTFPDLARLTRWVKEKGGGMVGTLPLLASFLDEPFSPSPYSPVSRLFWNEFFVDPARIPELRRCRGAAGMVSSASRRARLKELRSADLVDYREGMRVRRELLAEMSRCFFEHPGDDRADFDAYTASTPVLDYARFRATCELRGPSWHSWPGRLRGGKLRAGDYDPEVARYHAYVQWRTSQQVARAAQAARRGGRGLYLDLPLGVHPDGYDAWRNRESFAEGVNGGAPPDSFFTRGQDWGFRPLHPERIREDGYGYFADALRHHLRQAGTLRIDHVMALHRLFWVPHGMAATEGVYVRYRAEEFYAILCLESQRHGAMIVGEDLGTVPPEVRPAMKRHGIQRMYVLQFEANGDARRALAPVPGDCIAALNTHDMSTFAGFWEGLDIADRVALGLLDEEGAGAERRERAKVRRSLIVYLRRLGLLGEDQDGPQDVLRAVLVFLGRSPARGVMVNLEDLWLERAPQNTPGTSFERPNWRRRARHTQDEISRMRSVAVLLDRMARSRKEGAVS